MNKPLVSVVMITYNHYRYISKAIEGVLSQKTEFLYELVIGEDCSTDGTQHIVKKYAENYPNIIRALVGEKNIGARENAYRAEKACEGKYIAYCDGDDYWHNSIKLQKQIEFFELNPEFGLIFSDFNCYFTKYNKTIYNYRRVNGKITDLPNNRDQLLIKMLHGDLGLATSTICIRKSLLDMYLESKLYKYQKNFPMGDTPKWAYLSRLTKFHYINESLATHNILAESASKSENEEAIFKFKIKGTELCLHLAQRYKLPCYEVKHFSKRLRQQRLKLAFLKRNYDMARKIKRENNKLDFKEQIFYWSAKFNYLNWLARKYIRIKSFRSRYQL